MKETVFLTVYVPQSLLKGKPIGFGECKAVRLRLNGNLRNTITSTGVFQFYYGDANLQEYEVLLGQESILIMTDRLEKVFVRNPYAATQPIQVQVFI